MNKIELKGTADALISKIRRLEEYCSDSSELSARIKLPELVKLRESLEHNFLAKIASLPDVMPEPSTATTPLEEAAFSDTAWATYNYINKVLPTITKETLRATELFTRAFADDPDDPKFTLKRAKYNTLKSDLEIRYPSLKDMIKILDAVATSGSKDDRAEGYKKGVTILELLHTCAMASSVKDSTPPAISPYPDYFLKDDEFASHVSSLAKHRKFFAEVITNLTPVMKDERVDKGTKYDFVINGLQSYHARYVTQSVAASERHDMLVASRTSYNHAIESKLVFLNRSRNFRSHPLADLKVIEFHDEKLATSIRVLLEKITDWERSLPDNSEVFFKAGVDVAGQLNRVASVAHKDIVALLVWHDKLDEQIKALLAKIQRGIKERQDDFSFFYAHFNEHYAAEPGAGACITELKTEFDAACLMATGSLSALDAKFQRLTRLSERSQTLLGNLKKQINEKISTEIDALHNDKIHRIQRIENTVLTGGFIFSMEEASLLERVKAYRNTPLIGGDVPDYEGLCAKREELRVQLSHIKGFEDLLVLHNAAKVILNRRSSASRKLLWDLNNNTEAANLLRIVGYYFTPENESTFLGALVNSLHLVKFEKLGLIKTFIEGREGDAVVEIRKRIAFIELVSTTRVQAFHFLNNPKAMSAATVLNDLNLQCFINHETLSNESFCNALEILQKHQIQLTESRVRTLLFDKNKYEIICQQSELNGIATGIDRGYVSLASDVFKALINDFLDADASVAEAIYKVHTARVNPSRISARFSTRFSTRIDPTAPNYCTPWLLVLIKEHKELRDLICNPRFEENLPFLMPLLQQVKESATLARPYMLDYLSLNAGTRTFGKERLLSIWLHQQDKDILKALQNANRRPAVHRFTRMSALMRELNNFIDVRADNALPADKIILKKFRKEAMLVLLSTDTVEQKKAKFENLAYNHFAHPKYKTNLLKDVLQFITGLFIVIMPLRYLLGCDSVFFTGNKSEGHAEASRALENALRTTP